ncbi:MAG: hypothetical protein ACE15C_02945 [Phycisphaerae bacterium]
MCPLVDVSNPRCAPHLTLNNIIRAFTHCADRYSECTVYRELVAKAGEYESDRATRALLRAS